MSGKIGGPRINEQINYIPSKGKKGPNLEIPLNGRKIKITDPSLEGPEQNKILTLANKGKQALKNIQKGNVSDQSHLIIKFKPTSFTEKTTHFFRRLFGLGAKPLNERELSVAIGSIGQFTITVLKEKLGELEQLYEQLKTKRNNKELKSQIRTIEKAVTDCCQDLKIANPKISDLTIRENSLHAELTVMTTRWLALNDQKKMVGNKDQLRWEKGQKPERYTVPELTADENREFEELKGLIADKRAEINKLPFSSNTENAQVNLRHVREQLAVIQSSLAAET